MITSEEEYDAEFKAVVEPPLRFVADNMSQVRKAAARARRIAVAKRVSLRGEISLAWKEGYSKLKAENDAMEKNLDASFKDIMEWTHEEEENFREALMP